VRYHFAFVLVDEGGFANGNGVVAALFVSSETASVEAMGSELALGGINAG